MNSCFCCFRDSFPVHSILHRPSGHPQPTVYITCEYLWSSLRHITSVVGTRPWYTATKLKEHFARVSQICKDLRTLDENQSSSKIFLHHSIHTSALVLGSQSPWPLPLVRVPCHRALVIPVHGLISWSRGTAINIGLWYATCLMELVSVAIMTDYFLAIMSFLSWTAGKLFWHDIIPPPFSSCLCQLLSLSHLLVLDPLLVICQKPILKSRLKITSLAYM